MEDVSMKMDRCTQKTWIGRSGPDERNKEIKPNRWLERTQWSIGDGT